MEESSRIMASADLLSERARRLLRLGIKFAGADGGIICWRPGTPGVTPDDQVSWPKPGRTGVPTACLQRVFETGKSIAPADVTGRTWADESPNGCGRVVVLPLPDGDCVGGAMGFHFSNGASVPDEEAARVLRSIANLVVALRGRAVSPAGATGEERRMVGASSGIAGVRAKIEKVAAFDSTVLISGETGTGKELIARAIHEGSPRRSGPFVPLNCAAMPESLMESEIFGHEEGAFTGAVRRHKGKIEQARGGTLFLDEIGDMPSAEQAKLLRFLQEGVFERVGGEETLRADVRVIAATNRDLRAKVASGEFREDLLHRLSVVKISIPPLRERREDIPAITSEILRRLEVRQGRSLSITPKAVDLLARQPWTGNIRELGNVVEAAAVLGGADLDASDFAGILFPAMEPLPVSADAAALPASTVVPPYTDSPEGAVAPPGSEPLPTASIPPASGTASSIVFEPWTARGVVLQLACDVLRKTGFRICTAANMIGWTRQWLRKFIIKHKLDELLGFTRIRRKPAAAT